MWWAITTITTVGYGDEYPVTGEGRLVAVLLMFGGIALLGVVTAAVASWFGGRVADAAQTGAAPDNSVEDGAARDGIARVDADVRVQVQVLTRGGAAAARRAGRQRGPT